MTPNKPLTWESVPEKLREMLDSWQYSDDNSEEEDKDQKLSLAEEIMQAMKPELEKAFKMAIDWQTDFLSDEATKPDFEIWYNKTYNLCQPKK